MKRVMLIMVALSLFTGAAALADDEGCKISSVVAAETCHLGYEGQSTCVGIAASQYTIYAEWWCHQVIENGNLVDCKGFGDNCYCIYIVEPCS
jgi:hypothetical protein